MAVLVWAGPVLAVVLIMVMYRILDWWEDR